MDVIEAPALSGLASALGGASAADPEGNDVATLVALFVATWPLWLPRLIDELTRSESERRVRKRKRR